MRTQNADVPNVIIVDRKPGFAPLGVTRLYTHSRSHMFVFMFQLSSITLKFGASSMFGTSTFAAPCHCDAPFAA